MLDQQSAVTTETPDGGAVVEFMDQPASVGLDGKVPLPAAGDVGHFANLANSLDEAELTKLGQDAITKLGDEKAGNDGWLNLMAKAMGLLGLTEIDTKSKDYEDDLPEGAQTTCSLMLTAVQKWVSNASREMSYVDGPVAAKHIDLPPGAPEPPDKDQVVERVEAFFNRYLKTRIPSWYNDMDRTLMNTARMGCSFKKVYADPQGPMPIVVEQIDPQHLIVQADGRSLYAGVPITHHIPRMQKNHALRLMEQGFYRRTTMLGSSLPSTDPVTDKSQAIAGVTVSVLDGEDTIGVYERHCWLIIEDDKHPRGLPRPYILTIKEDSGFVLRLQRNWLPGDQIEAPYQSFVAYQFQPGDSAVYAIGLCQMLYAVVLALKEGINAALAAAWLANHPGGFKSGEMSIAPKGEKMKRGEWIDTESPIGDITKSIMPFPFKGADQSLIALLEKLDADGRELAGVMTMNVAEAANSNTAPGTVLAALDEAHVIPASSHVRMYLAFEAELRMMLDCARRVWGKGGYQLEPGFALQPGDLDRVILMPRMRPGAFSRQRRIAEAQTILQTASSYPQQHDIRAALRRFYEALGTEDIDEILPPPQETQPADIVTEGKNALAGQPLKAGLTQDHQAHIRGHTAQVQLYASRSDLGDAGVAAAASLQAHIGDHLACDLAVRVAAVLGMPLQLFDQGMPPEIEMRIAPMVAQAIELVARTLSGQGMSPEDLALEIERLRGQDAKERELIKAQTAITTTGMKVGQQKDAERAKTAREVADNLMAYRVHVTPSGDAKAHAEAAADAKADAPNPSAGASAGARTEKPNAG